MQQCDIRAFTALCDVTYLLILSLLFLILFYSTSHYTDNIFFD